MTKINVVNEMLIVWNQEIRGCHGLFTAVDSQPGVRRKKKIINITKKREKLTKNVKSLQKREIFHINSSTTFFLFIPKRDERTWKVICLQTQKGFVLLENGLFRKMIRESHLQRIFQLF